MKKYWDEDDLCELFKKIRDDSEEYKNLVHNSILQLNKGGGIFDAIKPQLDKEFSFKKAYKSLAKMQEEKNRRYGNAALEPLNVFSGKTKVGHRLDDKLARVKFSGTLNKNDVSDLIGYLMLVCKENGWENFDDLID